MNKGNLIPQHLERYLKIRNGALSVTAASVFTVISIMGAHEISRDVKASNRLKKILYNRNLLTNISIWAVELTVIGIFVSVASQGVVVLTKEETNTLSQRISNLEAKLLRINSKLNAQP